MTRVADWWGVRHIVSAACAVGRFFAKLWNHLTLEGLYKVLAISLIITVGLGAFNTAQLRTLASDNHKLLVSVEEQTSPEAIARQKAQVEDIIGIIDCNQRQALQDALQGLVDRGILDQADVVTITRACQQQLDNQDTTTTTTTIPGDPGAGD